MMGHTGWDSHASQVYGAGRHASAAVKVQPSRAHGCDHWNGSRYCEALALHVDEVDDRRYCLEHAGPLAWSDRDVDGVSLGVRLAGELDVQYTPPARLLDVKESAA